MELRPQLLSRLTRCTAEHQVPGMFLESVLASANQRGAEVGGLARLQLLEGGRLVENYRYPVSWMLGMLDVLGQAAQSRGESYGDALYQAGCEAGLAYVRSSVGKMRAIVGAASGVHRSLEGVPSAASLAVNFGERAYRRVGLQAGELHFQQDLIGPAWNTGMVVASVRAALGLAPQGLRFSVEPTDADASSFVLRLEW